MDPSPRSQVPVYSISAPRQTFTEMSTSLLKAFQRSVSTIVRSLETVSRETVSLETVSNCLDGESSVGMCTGEKGTSYKY